MIGTTNIELIDFAKALSIPSYHFICKDEFNQVNSNTTSPINILVNLNDSDNNVNGHWFLSFINDDQNFYYSSFGDPIPNQVKEFIIIVDDRKILSSNF